LAFEPFKVSVEQRPGTVVARLCGEFDLAALEPFRRDVQPLLESARGGSLVIDLRGLSFMDSSGIRALVELNDESRRDGFQLVIVQGEGAVARAAELTGLGELVHLVEVPPTG
jgi:anti-sigma B factor antagonist